jgi:hypothetical protein
VKENHSIHPLAAHHATPQDHAGVSRPLFDHKSAAPFAVRLLDSPLYGSHNDAGPSLMVRFIWCSMRALPPEKDSFTGRSWCETPLCRPRFCRFLPQVIPVIPRGIASF